MYSMGSNSAAQSISFLALYTFLFFHCTQNPKETVGLKCIYTYREVVGISTSTTSSTGSSSMMLTA